MDADAGNGDGPVRLGSQHLPVQSYPVGNLRRVANWGRERARHHINVLERVLLDQRRAGRVHIVRADGDLVVAVEVVQHRYRASARRGCGVKHDSQQLCLAVVDEGVGGRDGHHVIDIVAAAATDVRINDQLHGRR